MKRLHVHVARLLLLIDEWLSWPECACGCRHDPRDHYGLHDDTYDT